MRKFSRAFILPSIQDYPVYAICINKVWYPCKKDITEIFIRGEGLKKLSKNKKMELVGNLPKEWTAEDIKKIGDKYNYYVAMGMLQGWGNSSLFDDGSYGLSHAKSEVVNMVRYGKVYDSFAEKIQNIGDQFIEELLKTGFQIDGKYLYYKKEFVAFLDRFNIHLLMYINHSLLGIAITKPIFDPISFDDMLKILMVAKDPNQIDTYISVEDRITYLTSRDVSIKIKSIFELQKVF